MIISDDARSIDEPILVLTPKNRTIPSTHDSLRRNIQEIPRIAAGTRTALASNTRKRTTQTRIAINIPIHLNGTRSPILTQIMNGKSTLTGTIRKALIIVLIVASGTARDALVQMGGLVVGALVAL